MCGLLDSADVRKPGSRTFGRRFPRHRAALAILGMASVQSASKERNRDLHRLTHAWRPRAPDGVVPSRMQPRPKQHFAVMAQWGGQRTDYPLGARITGHNADAGCATADDGARQGNRPATAYRPGESRGADSPPIEVGITGTTATRDPDYRPVCNAGILAGFPDLQ